ncbi:MAG TPA: sigma-70 family RNA polymerase sigma factor [Polyangiaceae bacterium]|nr:sigma-70 family RNA polymerase sigma factor [Polyangiaceae bacterium]
MAIRHFARPVPSAASATEPPELGEIYEAHFDFVWRSLRRLGVPEAEVEDAVHDVFLIAHRKLPEFEGKSTHKTWLFAIALRVAQNQRRSLGRRRVADVDADAVADAEASPDVQTERSRGIELGMRLLNELDQDKRVVFILAELEQLPASEIGAALGIPLFTVYSRLRAARRAFEAALARERARGAWRSRWTS